MFFRKFVVAINLIKLPLVIHALVLPFIEFLEFNSESFKLFDVILSKTQNRRVFVFKKFLDLSPLNSLV